MKIYTLPDSVVAKISAGEVIERPAYAVKELIENSIDARASTIDIQIEDAGLKQIIVQDNGEGMSEEDLKLSFLPHTTSKLDDEHDLIGIKTLGFRGEALASIAAISTLTIKTREKQNPAGYEITIRHGDIEHAGPVGTPPGTIVRVDTLFLSVPARKKFLKSAKTELRLITNVVTNFALSYPSLHFVLTHNGKTIFDLPGRENNLGRIKQLLGNSFFEELLPVALEDGFIQISGFIGRPQSALKNNARQFVFVNQRTVTDRMIQTAVKEAFGSLLPSSSTPIFILEITVPPEIVDVNVHPRKEQISFTNAQEIFAAVKQAVSESLQENNLTFKLAKFRTENSARLGETTSFSGELLKSAVLPWDRSEKIAIKPSERLMQIHQTYIFVPTLEGLGLIDQHAAHERILFEEFVTTFVKKKKDQQAYELNKPLTFDLSLSESQILEEFDQIFTELGFTIDHFQGSTFIIRTAPAVFKGRNLEKIIKDMLVDMAEGELPTIDLRTERMLAFLSCRAAVKAGDVLTERQMKDIIKRLEKTANNATCPHGRPTRIQISIAELDKLFKR
ncbi:MAG TPA: DNA mismatch repair endonuclease MutL [Patescibacteria group bacterium]|nr:DNA mismatch repair endonuclease MutL [Patescibacteria group bacterium]